MDKFTEALTNGTKPEGPEPEKEEKDDDGMLADLVAKAKGKIEELGSLLDEISKNC